MTSGNRKFSPVPLSPSQTVKADKPALRNTAVKQEYVADFEDPPRVTHQEHVNRVLHLEEVSKYTTILQDLELARAKAQYALQDAEEDLDEFYEKTQMSIDNLKELFTPPGSPSKAHRIATASVANPVGTVAAAPIVRGGRIDISALSPVVSAAASPTKYPAPIQSFYIIYHGRGGVQGLFDYWKSATGGISPETLCNGYDFRLSKKFADGDMARMYYKECEESGVLEVLREQPSSNEILFVIKGLKPGVYTKRLTFLIEGLGWRGGLVMAAIGTRSQGDMIFNQWQVAGRVRALPLNGPRRHFTDEDPITMPQLVASPAATSGV